MFVPELGGVGDCGALGIELEVRRNVGWDAWSRTLTKFEGN